MYYWRKFDLVGIVLQIMGGQVPAFYYIFYCKESHHMFFRYVGFSWAVCIGAVAVVMMPDKLKSKTKHHLCALAFLLAGWSVTPGVYHIMCWRDET